MKLTNHPHWCLNGFCILVLTGCAAMTENTSLPADILHASAHCGGQQREAAVHLIEDAPAFSAATRRMRPQGAGSGGQTMPQPDFEQSIAVLLEMGQKPTGGYGLSLREPNATLEDGTLRLVLNWIEPAPGAMVTQALTSPCLLLAVPRQDINRVEATDQHGKVRATSER